MVWSAPPSQQARWKPGPSSTSRVIPADTVCCTTRPCAWAVGRARSPARRSTDFLRWSTRSTTPRSSTPSAEPPTPRLTVVNRYLEADGDEPPVYRKLQCMHCNEPCCATVCLVHAFEKTPEGPVLYHPGALHGLPLLRNGVPLQRAGLRVRRSADAKGHALHHVLRQDQRGPAPRLRRSLSDGRDHLW